ncbi:MAG: PA14 domain-containing protein [Thermoplasmatota archaeon]
MPGAGAERTPVDMRKGSAMLLAVILMSIVAVQTSYFPLGPENTEAVPVPGGSRSIDEVSSLRIFEKHYGMPGAGIGAYFWTGDVNGDGTSDLAVPAQGAPGQTGIAQDGKVSFLFGGDGWNWSVRDLASEEPDILMIGAIPVVDPTDPLDFQHEHKLSNHVDAGDVDGDGYLDILVTYTYIFNGGKHLGYFLLMGREEGWQKVIPLSIHSQPEIEHRLLSSAGPIGDLQTSRDLQYSDHISLRDINGDGKDEMTMGYFMSADTEFYPNRVTVRTHSGSEDYININDDHGIISKLGKSIAIGDVDGNGMLDLVVGSPLADHPLGGPSKSGTVNILWDMEMSLTGRDYNVDELDVRFTVPQASANLGEHLIVRDIDGDGRDDIIAGAPGWDGPNDGQVDIGEIYVVKGADNASFARYTDIRTKAHRILRGVHGQWRDGHETYPGSRIGRMFQLCDTNGDGNTEIIIGDHSRTGIGHGGRILPMRGEVSLLDLAKIMQDTDKTHLITEESSMMTVTGRDEMDSFGYYIQTADIDDDGFDDILVGSPGGDGPDNQRPRSGEIDIIRGTGLLSMEPQISGEGADPPVIFRGGGMVNMTIPFLHSLGASNVESVMVRLDPENENISMYIENDGVMKTGDRFDSVDIHSGGILYDALRGMAYLNFRMGWFTPLSGPLDLEFIYSLNNGQTYQRRFYDIFRISKDVVIYGEPIVRVMGEGPLEIGQWLTPGQQIEIGDLNISYANRPGRLIDTGPFSWYLSMDGERMETISHNEHNSFRIEIPNRDPVRYFIIVHMDGSSPAGFPEIEMPVIHGSLEIEVHVDLQPPDPPVDLRALSRNTYLEGYDLKGEYVISWKDALGSGGDPNGSGVKDYVLEKDGIPSLRPAEDGGLFGTYFIDERGSSIGMERIDEELDFGIRDWGSFGPEPNLVPPEHFSVRWHGWLEMDMEKEHIFSLTGSGNAKMILDGEVLIEGTVEGKGIRSDPVHLQKDRPYSVLIYFTHGEGASHFSFDHRDELGGFSPLPSRSLLHPSNITYLDLDREWSEISVRCNDWSGRTSAPAFGEVIKDEKPPSITIEDRKEWYGTTEPRFVFRIEEPPSSGRVGSGIDMESILLEIEDLSGDQRTFGMEEAVILTKTEENGTVKGICLQFEPKLPEELRGTLMVSARDNVGNRGTAYLRNIGIDLEQPDIALLSPDPAVEQVGMDLEYVVRASDHGGSGVDGSTFSYRSRPQRDEDWTDWKMLSGGGIDDAVSISGRIRLPYGMNELQFMVLDLVGNTGRSEVYEITMVEPVLNERPVPVISLPENGSVFYSDEPIVLDATGTHDDGMGPLPEVRLTWISNISGILKMEKNLTVRLEPGEHRITLYADDGMPGHNVSTSVSITVLERPSDEEEDDDQEGEPPGEVEDEDDDLMLVILFSLLMISILVIALFLFFRHSKRDTEQVLISMRERTEEDHDE